jgi:hypothetical protein
VGLIFFDGGPITIKVKEALKNTKKKIHFGLKTLHQIKINMNPHFTLSL